MIIKYNNSLLSYLFVPSQYFTMHLISNKDIIWNRIILFSDNNFFIDNMFYFFDVQRDKKIAIVVSNKDFLKLEYFLYNKSLSIYGNHLFTKKISPEYNNKLLQIFDFLKTTHKNP